MHVSVVSIVYLPLLACILFYLTSDTWGCLMGLISAQSTPTLNLAVGNSPLHEMVAVNIT